MTETPASSVLVVYASKTGTTREIADRLAAIAGSAGHTPTLHDVDEGALSGPLTAWDRVVLGAPVNGMQPAAGMQTFVRDHPGLNGRVAGVFLVSLVYPAGRTIWRRAVGKAAEKLAARVGCTEWTVFGGRSETPLPAFPRFLFGVPADIPADQRDWEAILAWGNRILAP